MNRPLRVLIAEDNPTDAELILRELRRAGFEPEWDRVDTEAAYLERLRPELDVILSDDKMPRFSGARALELLQERCLDVPFIIVSGTIGEEMAVDAMKRGAADYLLKDRLARLGAAVNQAMERMRADEAGRKAKAETERHLALLETSFDTLAEGVVVSDLEGNVLYWNRAALAIHGYASQDECRRQLSEFQDTFEFVEPGETALPFDRWPMVRILRGETVTAWEGLLRKKGAGGWEKWLSYSGAVAYNKEGLALLAVLSIEDITERRKTDRALRLFRTLIEHIDDAIEVIDSKTGRFLDMNEKGCMDLGYTREEILAMTVSDIDPLMDSAAIAKNLEVLREKGSLSLESLHRRKDGSSFPVEISVKRIHLDREYLVTVVRDITGRMEVEAELRDSQRFLRSITEASPHFVYIFDLDLMGVTYANRSILNDLGYPPEAQGSDHRQDWFREFMAPGETPHLVRLLDEWRTLSERELRGDEYLLSHADGSTRSFAGREVVFARRPDGTVWQILGTLADITERKRAEQAVQASQRMLQLILNNIPQGVFWKDSESSYLGCNAIVARTFGIEESESVKGRKDRDFACLTAEQAEFFVRKDREVMASDKPQFGIVEQATFADGVTRWLETNKTPLHDTEGNVIGVLGTWHDITERREAEAALEMMRFSVDKAGDSIFWINREGRILYVNDAACASRGYSREELLGMSIFDLDPDYHVEAWDLHFEDLKGRGSITLETRHRTKDGHVFPVEANANYVHLSGQEFNFCFFRDVTLRKQNEEEIRRLAAFPQVNPNPVFELTAEGSIHYHNAAGAALAGELGFSHPGEMLPPDAAGIVRECLATRTSRLRLETVFGRRILSWSFYPIPDRSIVHCYASEVTNQRQLAEQLRQVQKMESVGQLAAGIAHDFNNLLTVIHGYSELLREQLADRPQDVECVEQIAIAGERAAKLTRQLLLFSRKHVVQRRLCDLNELAGNLTKMLGRILGEDIALRLECSPSLPLVHADPGMIEQVITNLSVNARDAMPDGGRLEITTSVADLDAARVRGNPEAQPGRFVCLAVSDTGSGIAPQNLSKIFEPFFTTKEVGKGTGLGLATVYGIVMQHQGVVEAVNQPGAGARFHVFLPAASPAAEAATGAAPPRPKGGSETILLVEDEAAVRSLLELLLKQAGYTVLTAVSGVAALRIWPENRENIDLLLTDMVMPEDVSGKQLAERLTREKPGLRVIFMSGYSPEIRGGASGVEEGLNYLQKPVTHTALLRAVRRQLDARG